MSHTSTPIKRRELRLRDPAFPFEAAHIGEPANNMEAFHWHDFMELSYVEKGEGTYEVEGKTFPVRRGDIVVINNIERHRVRYRPGSRLYETVLHFTPEFIWSSRKDDFDYRYLKLFLYHGATFANKPALAPSARREVSALIHQIAEEYQARRPQYELMVKSRLLTIIAHLLRSCDIRPRPADEVNLRRYNVERLDSIVSYLRAHHTENALSLQSVAAAFDLNPSYFSDYFKKNLGQGFLQYLTSIRVHDAMRMLKDRSLSTSQVAFACGFGNPASFATAFRKVSGVSPASYRAIQRT
jgi:AraC-like DNA-binding protein